jgi:hypothetical protein
MKMATRSQIITLLKGETFTFLYGSKARQTQEITVKANQQALLRCPSLGLTMAIVRQGSGRRQARLVKNIPVNTRVIVLP